MIDPPELTSVTLQCRRGPTQTGFVCCGRDATDPTKFISVIWMGKPRLGFTHLKELGYWNPNFIKEYLEAEALLHMMEHDVFLMA